MLTTKLWLLPQKRFLDVYVCSKQYAFMCIYIYIKESLEVKLPTKWTDEKQRWKKSERREEWKREE
jgi:hypothetical protein